VYEYSCDMSSKSDLESVDAVIDAFGGVKGMCEIFGGGPTRFYNFKAKRRFPKSMHMDIYNEACARGLNIRPELIGRRPAPRQSELILQVAE
jgi:hypothetical protein